MENSVVVLQFVDLARGAVPLHRPSNEFRTVGVTCGERYCLKCFDVRVFDMWFGVHDGLNFCLGRCRFCGTEVTL